MLGFWGVEVKSGSTYKVQLREGKILHLSQACLGNVKSDNRNDYIRLFAENGSQKFVIGMLSPERFPQINLDLIFDGRFTLSHDLKKGSVHFIGYEVDSSGSPVDEDESDDDLEELVPIDSSSNGKPEAKDSKPSEAKANVSVKLEKTQGKSKVKIMEPGEGAKKNAENDETEDDEDDESAEDEDMASSDAGSDEEDDSDDEEDSDEEDSGEETPKKPEPAKKRIGESSKTPVPEKKAKFSTPEQKADGKKVIHIDTPHPAKQTGKTPANANKSNKQTPTKSFACPSCNKLFGSEQAVQSHSKDKHSSN